MSLAALNERMESAARCVHIVLLGATGATGFAVLQQLLRVANNSVIRVLTRRDIIKDLPNDDQKRIQQTLLDNFDALSSVKNAVFEGADTVICALGTTRAASGVKGFIKVDYTYTLEAATLAKDAGVASFHLVSASNANASSFFLYPQIKGKVEDEIRRLQFPRLWIYRPGLLLTPQRTNWRFLESVAQTVCRAIDAPSCCSVSVSVVAEAIVSNIVAEHTSIDNSTGVRPSVSVVTHDAIVNIGRLPKPAYSPP